MNYYLKINGDKRMYINLDEIDFSRNIGQIISKFNSKDKDGKLTPSVCLGTGQVIGQIEVRKLMIATCAHNFIKWDRKILLKASLDGTSFYLQRDGKDKSKMEMRIIDFVVHPDYLEDG